MGLRDVAADHDHRRVDQVHRCREHLADQAARLAHQPHRRSLAGPGELDDRARVGGVESLLPQLRRHRAASRERLEAADVPAAAGDLLGALDRDADVADVAGGALGAAVDAAADDDPAADPGTDLDEQQVLDLRPVRPVLAEGHDVDVVVDQHRDAVAVGEALRDRVAVPAGHDRRVPWAAGHVLDRPRDADPDPPHVLVVAADLAQQGVEALIHPVEHSLGPRRDLDVLAVLGEDAPAQVGDAQAGVRRSKVRREHDPGGLVEREQHRRPAAGGRALAGLSEEVLGQELLDPLGDGGARRGRSTRRDRRASRRRPGGSAAASSRGRRAEPGCVLRPPSSLRKPEGRAFACQEHTFA